MHVHGMALAMEPTERQLELLMLHAQGLTFQEIGAKVHLSPWTVKRDLDQLRGRIKARTLSQAVVICIGRGELCVDGRSGTVFVPFELPSGAVADELAVA